VFSREWVFRRDDWRVPRVRLNHHSRGIGNVPIVYRYQKNRRLRQLHLQLFMGLTETKLPKATSSTPSKYGIRSRCSRYCRRTPRRLYSSVSVYLVRSFNYDLVLIRLPQIQICRISGAISAIDCKSHKNNDDICIDIILRKVWNEFGYHQQPNSELHIKVTESCTKLIGTSADLKPKTWVKFFDLLYGTMLPSGNDAAHLLS
jgi:hypothetical protein